MLISCTLPLIQWDLSFVSINVSHFLRPAATFYGTGSLIVIWVMRTRASYDDDNDDDDGSKNPDGIAWNTSSKSP